ncbi:MAG TPA: chemotaxis protein CheW [Steroidobacteraceae bacterium]|nr:chemotaxis protein CheW [Steroidobacteraceae bacterium]
MSAHAEWLTEDAQFIGGEPTAPRILEKAIVALARTFDLPEQDAQPTHVRQQRWRGLRIGNLGLLVDHSCGGEIIEDAKVFALPRAAKWCRGLINLRGHLIPAIDLHELIGLTHLRAARQWWLALGRSEDALAFPIDALPVALEAQEAAQVHATLIPEALRAFTGNGHRIGGELWLEFRHGEFFKSLARL